MLKSKILRNYQDWEQWKKENNEMQRLVSQCHPESYPCIAVGDEGHDERGQHWVDVEFVYPSDF